MKNTPVWIPAAVAFTGGRLVFGPLSLVIAMHRGASAARWAHPCGLWMRCHVGEC